MLGLREIAALNDDFIKKYTPLLPKSPPNRGDLFIVLYTAGKGKMYKGKTGPYLNDSTQVTGWSYDEHKNAISECVRLQGMVALDVKVSLDRL